MMLRQRLHLPAGVRTAISKSEQTSHLIERKAEFARSPDEGNPRDIGVVIDPAGPLSVRIARGNTPALS